MTFYRVEEVLEEHWMTKEEWMKYLGLLFCLFFDREIKLDVVNLISSSCLYCDVYVFVPKK